MPGEVDREEAPCHVPGDAPTKVKEFVQRLLRVLSDGFGARTAQCLDLVEVSVLPNVNEPTRQEARVVLEMTVTEDMLNPGGMIHGACIVHLVDICTSLPTAAMSLVNDGKGSAGVSQNINTIFHAPASLHVSSSSQGDRLRLITTSTTIGARTRSARIEIWDVTHHRLVASATHVKMEPSPPKL